MSSNGRKAVFLDKDGTIIENVPYNVDTGDIRFAEDLWEALGLLAAAGFEPVIVSNQPGVACGRYTEKDVLRVIEFIEDRFRAHGINLRGFYYCPHHPEGTVRRYSKRCLCRKPAPGLIEQASAELGLDTGRSWFIGDILDDVEAGHRAGCRSVLIKNGNETEWRRSPARRPDMEVESLAEAAERIAADDAR